MKVSPKFLALMAAMAVGVAGAAPTASTQTQAGNTIDNTATASYTDPANPSNTTPLTSTSNTVTTKVLPLPSFDIVYASGYADGSTNGNANTAAGVAGDASAPAVDNLKNVSPGATVTDTYYLVNNGNTPLNVTVTANKTGVTDVTYAYTDNATGATITPNGDGTIPLAYGQIITITQTTKVPGDAAAGSVVGASPQGSATASSNATLNNNTGVGIPAGTAALYENQTVSGTTVSGPANGTDLQYQALNIYNTTIKNNPNTPDGTTDVTTKVTPPGSTTPVPGYPGGTPSTTTTPPGGGTTPGTTPIVSSLSGDKQEAYPPADGNTDPDVVVFTNTVKNNGGLEDTVTLKPIDGTSTWTKTGVGTYTDQNGNTVQFINPATGSATDTVIVPAGGVANYTTQVTYPDSNSTNTPTPITVVIGATSGLNPNITADPTTDIIYPPAMTFGDTAKVTQAPNVVEDPSTGYYPGSQTTTSNTAPGETAKYPMSVSNSGTYADSTTLSGYVPVKLVDGTTKYVPIVYTDANGNTLPLAKNADGSNKTTLAPDGTTVVPVYVTPVIAKNSFLNVVATVPVPSDALATTGNAGTNPEPKLQQTATGVFSTIQQTDLNDPLAIAPKGNVVVGKFTKTTDGLPAAGAQYASGTPATVATGTAPDGVLSVTNPAGYNGLSGVQANTQYAPGVPYSYQIIAKNGYNSPISGFFLTDDLNGKPFNTVAATDIACSDSGVASITGNVAKCDWSATPVPANAQRTMTINVTIK